MLLKNDHRAVLSLFKEIEDGVKGRQKKAIVTRIIRELSIHSAIEEQLFYPACREASPQLDKKVLESLEEHHVAKWLLSELESMGPEDERYAAKLFVLMENIRHHIKEEEEELFPMVRQQMDARKLKDLGDELEKAKRVAPTHPHPRAPDTPPGNILGGLGMAALDRARDAGKRVTRKLTGRRTTNHHGAKSHRAAT